MPYYMLIKAKALKAYSLPKMPTKHIEPGRWLDRYWARHFSA